MASVFRPTYTRKDPTSGEPVRHALRKWYIKYLNADGAWETCPGFRDKQATIALANEMERKAARVRAGIAMPWEDQLKRPLAQHIAEWHAALLARQNTPKHANLVTARARRVVEACGFKFASEIAPSRIEVFLGSLRDEGASKQTLNFYLQAIKQLARWMVLDRRSPDNPIAYMKGQNVETDRRHDRRAFEDDELDRLIRSARASTHSFRSIEGPYRAMLYLVAANTGLRAGELASLAGRSFVLGADEPAVRVEASYSKRRRLDEQPLPTWLVEDLRVYLAPLDANALVWPGTWGERPWEMLKHDLHAAGIEYRDEDGLYADFHALRHTYISNLQKAGVSPKQAQLLARHSDINLTMKRYTHIELRDLSRAVQGLPQVGRCGGSDERRLAATGTEGPRVADSRGHGGPLTARGTDNPHVAGDRVQTRQLAASVTNGDAPSVHAQQFDQAPAIRRDELNPGETAEGEGAADGTPPRASGLHAGEGAATGVTEDTPGQIRTADLRFRKPPLYPTELRAQRADRTPAQGAPRWVDYSAEVGDATDSNVAPAKLTIESFGAGAWP